MIILLSSCNFGAKNYHNGTYALKITMFGINVNTDDIFDGNKYNNK
jgi:hypothetical protein